MTQSDPSFANGLRRPVFFDRQSLTAEDLNCLVEYVRAERRRHNRTVVGWGVTGGLEVAADEAEPWTLRIGRGHAIARSGTEIELLRADSFDICEAVRTCIDLPDPCENPFDLEERVAREDGPRAAAGPLVVDFTDRDPRALLDNPLTLPFGVLLGQVSGTVTPDRLQILKLGPRTGLLALPEMNLTFVGTVRRVRLTLVRFAEVPQVAVFDADGAVIEVQQPAGPTAQPQVLTFETGAIAALAIRSKSPDLLVQRIEIDRGDTPLGTVYLAVCADETPACYKPGMPEHCSTAGDGMQPARILEGHRFTILCTPPQDTGLPDCDTLERWTCEDVHIPPADTSGPDCVVLAAITVSAGGIVDIDNFSHRRRLPPAWVTAAQGACCCCGDTPAPTPPPTPTPSIAPTSVTSVPPSIFVTAIPTLMESLPPSFIVTATPSMFFSVQPSFFVSVQPSILPSLIPSFLFSLQPSLIDDVDVLVTPGGLDFNPTRGRAMGLDVLDGVGAVRRAALEELNVTNVAEFIEMDSLRLSAALGVSEVKVAELQEDARLKTLDEAPLFDRTEAEALPVTALTGLPGGAQDKLAAVGITTLSGLIETDRRVLAGVMDVPLESVLKLQASARKRTLRTPG